MKLLLILTILITSSASAEVSIIVNASSPVSSLSREQVADYFLKRTRQWPSGTPVRFFDRENGSELRKYFLRNYIRKSYRDIELFWIGQKLYSGHSAPTQVSSDAMVEILVSRFPGAIGYVSEDYIPKKSVKKINITGL